MASLYREFTVNQFSVWQAIVTLVKSNAQAFIESGKPLRVIVTSSDKKRNAEQNAYYWGVTLKSIAAQAWVGGKRFEADIWHEHFARKYGVCEDITLPNGEVVVRRKSTTDMLVGEFSNYVREVEAEAATEFGVIFPAGEV